MFLMLQFVIMHVLHYALLSKCLFKEKHPIQHLTKRDKLRGGGGGEERLYSLCVCVCV